MFFFRTLGQRRRVLIALGALALALIIGGMALILMPHATTGGGALGDPNAARRTTPTPQRIGVASAARSPQAAASAVATDPVTADAVAAAVACINAGLTRSARADADAAAFLADLQRDAMATPPDRYRSMLLVPLESPIPADPCAIATIDTSTLNAPDAAIVGIVAVPDTNPDDGMPAGYALILVGTKE